MNPFSRNQNQSPTGINRFTIKSKYFGEYQPQLFIASKSKSKQKSVPKIDVKYFASKLPSQQVSTQKSTSTQRTNNYETVKMNPQMVKSPRRNYGSSNLSEYLLTRNLSPSRKKESSAIQLIIEWVQKKYNQKIQNQSTISPKSYSSKWSNQLNKTQSQKFQYALKKITYDLYILKRLKNKSNYLASEGFFGKNNNQTNKNKNYLGLNQQKNDNKVNKNNQKYFIQKKDLKNQTEQLIESENLKNSAFLPVYSKQNAIDSIQQNQSQKYSTKVQDFTLNRLRAQQYQNNLFPISQVSLEYINRSNMINSKYSNSSQFDSAKKIIQKDEKFNMVNEFYSESKEKFDIPTMNSLEALNSSKNNVRQNDKKYPVENDYLKKIFFNQTARSTSTNQILEVSKQQFSVQQKQRSDNNINNIYSPSLSQKQLNLKEDNHRNYFSAQYLSTINCKNNKFQNTVGEKYENFRQEKVNEPEYKLKISNKITLKIKGNTKIQTGVCEIDYWPNSLFHSQNSPFSLIPLIQSNLSNDEQNSQIILNQIFLMNDYQQQVLKQLKNQVSLSQISEKSSISNKSKIKKNPGQDYLSQHLNIITDQNNFNQASNQPVNQPIKQFLMPLSRAHNEVVTCKLMNNKIQKYAISSEMNKGTDNKNDNKNNLPFAFNSIANKNQLKSNQNQMNQLKNYHHGGNAFIKGQNSYINSNLTSPKKFDHGRQNYFSSKQTNNRQRIISCNSNQSKTSSKPKVSFNYVSPDRQIYQHIQSKPLINQYKTQTIKIEEEQHNSVLFKSQNSYIKNSGNAPIKIEIKNQSKANKHQSKINKNQQNYEKTQSQNQIPQKINKQMRAQTRYQPLKQQNNTQSSMLINRVQRSRTTFDEQKLNSYSTPKFIVNNRIPVKQNIQIPQYKNAFANPLQNQYVLSSYYRSQNPPSNPDKQNVFLITNYQTPQSYYFPQNQFQKQKLTMNLNNGFGVEHNNLRAPRYQIENSKINEENLVLLYPLQNSKQKSRSKRARSLNEKIFLTIKHNQS